VRFHVYTHGAQEYKTENAESATDTHGATPLHLRDAAMSRNGDIVHHLQDYGLDVQLHDPLADPGEAFEEYGVTPTGFDALQLADLVVLAVPHRNFLQNTDALIALAKPGAVFADVKSSLPLDKIRAAGLVAWRL
jgi:UDP-N-acetyl-D-galactosamine dehydrogenase